MGAYIKRADARRSVLREAPHLAYAIDRIPSANVLSVIRCRDCKKFGTVFCALDVNRTDVTIKRATENDYCSKAEQK